MIQRQKHPYAIIWHGLHFQAAVIATFAFLVPANRSHAQTGVNTAFQETIPPAGVVKGYMKFGDRYGVVLAGGRTVYSNDTFTVTTMGQAATWKVLGVYGMRGRFAKATPEGAAHIPPREAADFGQILSVLQKGAASYNSASTGLLKDKAMSELRQDAQSWCESNSLLRIKAVLSELHMVGENSACIRITKVNTGNFKAEGTQGLYIHPVFVATIPLSLERALTCKAGDTVILWGRPIFRQPSEVRAIINGLVQQAALTSFRTLPEATPIGELELASPECEIYNPKRDTVKTN